MQRIYLRSELAEDGRRALRIGGALGASLAENALGAAPLSLLLSASDVAE